MSKTIDSKVVEMKFDNDQFEKGVKQSMNSIKQLNKSLDMKETTKGLEDLQKTASSFNLEGLTNAAQSVADRFSTMGIVAMTVIQDITQSLIGKFTSAFSKLDALIIEGGKNRASNIEKAKFQLEGLGIVYKDVADAIDYAVTDTAYSLDAAAVAASQLASAGLNYKDVIFVHKKDQKEITQMSLALKAVSGVAAQTQSDYSMVARYFQDVANAGKVAGSTLTYMTQVLNMPVSQNLAEGLNAIVDGSYEASESVVKAAKKITGGVKVTAEDIAGFCKDGVIDFDTFATIMFNKYGDHAKEANNTISGVMSNIHSAFAKIGADFYGPILANKGPLNVFLESFRQQINNIRKAITPITTGLAKIVNEVISRGTNLLNSMNWGSVFKINNGHMEKLAETVRNTYSLIFKVLSLVKNAFEEVTHSGEKNINVYHEIYSAIELVNQKVKYFYGLLTHGDVADNFKNTLKGLFAIFDIGAQVVSAVWSIIKNVIFQLSGNEIGKNILETTGHIGEMIASFDEFLKSSGFFETAVTRISNAIVALLYPIGTLNDTLKMNISNYGKIGGIIKTVLGIVPDGINAIIEAVGGLLGLKLNYESIADKVNDFFYGGIINPIAKAGQSISESFNAGGIWTKLKDYFKSLGEILSGIKGPSEALGKMADNFKEFASKIASAFNLTSLKDGLSKGFTSVFEFVGAVIKDLLSAIVTIINGFFDTLEKLDFEKALSGTGLLLMIDTLNHKYRTFDTIKSTMENFVDFFVGGFKKTLGTMDDLAKALNATKNSLFAWQRDLKANTLLKLAGALGILAVSMLLLSTIDTQKLFEVLAVVGLLATGLAVAFDSLGKADFDSIPFGKDNPMREIGNNLIKFAAAILILSIAIKKLAKLDQGAMWSSVGAIIVLMGALLGMVYAFSRIKELNTQLGKITGSLLIFAVAIELMASAVKKLAKLDTASMWMGVLAVAALMALLTGMVAVFNTLDVKPAEILAICGALAIFGIAMEEMSLSVALLSALPVGKMWSAVGAVAVLILAVGLLVASFEALSVNPGFLLAFGASMVLLGFSLIEASVGIAIIAGALLLFNKVDWASVGKLGVVLLELAVAMAAMSFGMIGAVAMIVMAGALAIFIPMLIALSAVPADTLSNGLIGLAKAFALIAAAAVGLGLLSPLLIAAGAALIVFGGGLLVVVAACAVAATALSLIITGLTALTSLDIGILGAKLAFVFDLIPILVKKFAEGIVMILETLTESKIKILNFIVTLFDAILDAIVKVGPKLIRTVTMLLGQLLTSLTTLTPQLFTLIRTFVTQLLEYLTTLIPQLSDTVYNIIIGLLNSLTSHVPEFVQAAVDLMNAFIQGIISMNEAIVQAGFDLIIGLIDGLAAKIAENTPILVESVHNLFAVLIEAAIMIITGASPEFLETAKQQIMENGLFKGISTMADSAKQKIKDVCTKMIDAIKTKYEDFRNAGKNAVQGLIDGLKDKIKDAVEAAHNMAQKVVETVTGAFDEHSPSKVFKKIGQFAVEGLAIGLTKYTSYAVNAARDMANNTINSVNDSISSISQVISDNMDFNPVITPTLDLSRVTAGANRISSMFDNAKISATGEVGQNGENGAFGATYNFTQNNYSPKALSRSEIYRQTKNQFSQLKGAVNGI